jgi:uncharacterized membrane protein HdeD (DUF308 family)
MSSRHQEKFISKMLLGFTIITAGILLIFFTAFERTRKEDWYFWGIVASIVINTGLYFLVTAFVHKIKSDFIKRQKQREQQRTVKPAG